MKLGVDHHWQRIRAVPFWRSPLPPTQSGPCKYEASYGEGLSANFALAPPMSQSKH